MSDSASSAAVRFTKQLGPPAPTAWYLLWAGTWLCMFVAYLLFEGPWDASAIAVGWAGNGLAMAGLGTRSPGWRKTLAIGVGIIVTLVSLSFVIAFLIFSSLSFEVETSTGFQFLHLSATLMLMIGLAVEAFRVRGVERAIFAAAAVPALGLLMIGGFIYFALQVTFDLPDLSGAWVWLAGGTLWIFAAAVIGRRYV